MHKVVNAIKLLRKLLLAHKTSIGRQNRTLPQEIEEDMIAIERDTKDISFAFQELEEWTKQVANEFESKIRQINEHSQMSSEFIKTIRKGVQETKKNVGNFLPQLGFVWATMEDMTPQEVFPLKMHDKIKQEYNELDEQLKLCFLSLSIFPPNSIIKRTTLINWWIGEGFVNPIEDKTAERVGVECFKKLLQKKLLEPTNNRNRKNKNVTKCTIDQAVRSMAIKIAQDNNFFGFDYEKELHSLCSRSPFIARGMFTVVPPTEHSDQLVSLLNLSGQTVKFDRQVKYKMKNLAVLQLGSWDSYPKSHRVRIINPKAFSSFLLSLKSLRYLGLQGVFEIKKLPDNIGELSELIILDLHACHNLESLPLSIGNLTNLTYLDCSDCHSLDHIPNGVQYLTKLQILKGFVMGQSSNPNQADLTHLAKIPLLRKLEMQFGTRSVVSQNQLQDGKLITSLQIVTITWLHYSNTSKRARHDHNASLSLDWLPSSIEKLDLRGYPLEGIPSELKASSFGKLKALYFRGGNISSLVEFSWVDQKANWEIETFGVRYLKDVKIESVRDLFTTFPRASCLEILGCPKVAAHHQGLWVLDTKGDLLRFAPGKPGEDVANFPVEHYYRFSNIATDSFLSTVFDVNSSVIHYSGLWRKLLFRRLLDALVSINKFGTALAYLSFYLIVLNMVLLPVVIFFIVASENVFLGLCALALCEMVISFYVFMRLMRLAVFAQVQSGIVAGIVMGFLVWLALSGRIISGFVLILIGIVFGLKRKLNQYVSLSEVMMAFFVAYLFLVSGHYILSSLSGHSKRKLAVLGASLLFDLELFASFLRNDRIIDYRV